MYRKSVLLAGAFICISFFLSALPGLDAHTRLMLGKRLEYRVTEKV